MDVDSSEQGAKGAPRTRASVVEIATGVTYLVGLGAAMTLVDRLLGASPLGTGVAGAVVANLVATRAGVRWSDGFAAPTTTDYLRAIARGTLPIVAAVAAIVIAARAIGAADVEAGAPGAALGFGLVRAVAVGVRDEMFYRGIPFAAAARAKTPRAWTIAFAALCGAAPLVFAAGSSPIAIALEITSGVAFALLWSCGPVAAIAAHAGWVLLAGAGLHGSILDVDFHDGSIALGAHASGTPAVLALAAMAGVAAFAFARARGRAPLRGPDDELDRLLARRKTARSERSNS